MEKSIKSNVSWVGFLDWELKNFHGSDYSTNNGSSQNAYLIKEEKIVLIDTVWTPNRCWFIKNLKNSVDLNKIDYIVINHSERDHSGALPCLMEHVPKNTPIYCSAACKNYIEGQYGKKGWAFETVKTGDELDIGNNKKLIFIDMKMLHWPDSIATYLTEDCILFSNDAFGQHLALQELFANKADRHILENEALKYFVNILNPYSAILLNKIPEIEKLKIDIIAPSHGAVWRENPGQIVEKYKNWATKGSTNENSQITIVYDTMWEGTKNIAHKIADKIYSKNSNIKVNVFNISENSKSDIATQIFKSYAIAVGAPTVYNSIPSNIIGFLEYLKQLKFKNKIAAAFGCYGWSGESVKILQAKLKESGFNIIEPAIKCLWGPKQEDEKNIEELVNALTAKQLN